MKIAVVIPCRNEIKNIQECIESIFHSIIPSDWLLNVIVVDGMSDDGTIELLHHLQLSYPNIKIVENKQRVTPVAFNLGVKEGADCDYIQIIGARQLIQENYIFKAVQRLQSDDNIWCVGGKVENVFQNIEGKVIASAMSTKLGMGIGNFRTTSNSSYVDTVGTPMYPNWVFDRIGYFDEDLVRNQDDDFNFRVSKAGGKIFFDADISLKYYVRGNYRNLWKQFNQYGYWKVFVNIKHKAVTTFRQLVPPLFVFYLLLAFASWLLGGLFGGISNFPLVCYIALVTYTSWKIKQEHEELKFVDIWKTFPILHISYGLGYLKGVWHFVVLKRKPSEMSKELSR